MQFCKAQVRAVKLKPTDWESVFGSTKEEFCRPGRRVRFWSAEQKPYRTSRRLRLMACRFAAQFLGSGRRPTRATPAPGEQGVQFTAPSHEHVANRDLGTVEHVNSNGDLRIGMDAGQEVRFNVREHPHLDYGYAVTSDSSQGKPRIECGKGQLFPTERGTPQGGVVSPALSNILLTPFDREMHVSTVGSGGASGRIGTDVGAAQAGNTARDQVVRRVRACPIALLNTFSCILASLSLRESCMHEMCTCSLRGGRRPARKRASSDPTGHTGF